MTQSTRFSRELASAHLPRSLTQLTAMGVTRTVRESRRWRAVSRGHYVPILPGDEATPTQRILDHLPLLREGGAVGGWAAGLAHGVDDFDGLDPLTYHLQDLFLCLGGSATRARRPGVRFSYERLPADDIVVLSGVPFTSPLRTGFDGARLAAGMRDSVAFVDALLRATRITPAQLSAYVDDRGRGWKGIAQARRAIGLADPASRNGWESRLRVWYVVEAGFPPPEVNIPVFDLTGRLIGIPDLLDVQAGTVLEFDGAGHRGRLQHRRDNVREEDFEHSGLQVVRADSLDLLRHESELQRRVSRARNRGLLRDRSLDTWTITEPDWWRAQSGEVTVAGLTDEEKADLFGRCSS